MPLKQAGAEVGGTRSHWYCLWFCSGSPAVKSKPHFLLRTSFWAASWRSMKFFDSCLSTGPNRSRLTRAREILLVIGFRTTAGDRSLAISDNATGLHTLALIVIPNETLFMRSTSSIQSQIGILLLFMIVSRFPLVEVCTARVSNSHSVILFSYFAPTNRRSSGDEKIKIF